jgi:hypothetical protein
MRIVLAGLLLGWLWSAAPAHADFVFANGSVTLTSGTGTQGVTDAACAQPKVILFFWTNNTAAGFQATNAGGFGISVDRGTDQHISSSQITTDNVATTSALFARHNTYSIVQRTVAGYSVLAYVSAFNSNGFTITKDTNDDASLGIIKYVCLGGSDLENAYVAEFAAPAGGGSQAETGVGFQGNLGIFLASPAGTGASPTTGSAGGFSFGAATSSSARAVTAFKTIHNTTSTGTNQSSSRFSASNVLLIPRTTTTTFAAQLADFTSFGADGFTLNWTNNTGTAAKYWALILKGTFQAHVGSQARSTSATTQDITSPGFQPKGIILAGGFATAADSDIAQGHMSLGAADGTNHHSVWMGDAATINTDTNRYSNASNVYSQATNPSTLAAQAAWNAWLSNGYQLNFGTADANARLFAHIALAGAASTRRPIAPMILGWLRPLLFPFLPSEAFACC